MKKLMIVVVFLIGGLLAYNFAATGELTLIPSFTLSQEEQQVRDLEDRFDRARKEMAQAGRMAGLAGIDSSSQMSAGLEQMATIEKEAKALEKNLQEPGALESLEALRKKLALAR
ncbi:MAG: hypothetical protein O7C74_06380 [Acidobacteria bacterium]|nr:hypothetical protein [Acidobacteriota bacterium]